MSGGRIALLIVGSLLALVGLGIAAGGGTLLWAHETQRDRDGYFTTSTERFRTPTFALTSDEVDLGAEGNAGWGSDIGDLARVRVRATSADSRPIFVGIGPRDAVERLPGARAPRPGHRRRVRPLPGGLRAAARDAGADAAGPPVLLGGPRPGGRDPDPGVGPAGRHVGRGGDERRRLAGGHGRRRARGQGRHPLPAGHRAAHRRAGAAGRRDHDDRLRRARRRRRARPARARRHPPRSPPRPAARTPSARRPTRCAWRAPSTPGWAAGCGWSSGCWRSPTSSCSPSCGSPSSS